jgi:hypothetical protein
VPTSDPAKLTTATVGTPAKARDEAKVIEHGPSTAPAGPERERGGEGCRARPAHDARRERAKAPTSAPARVRGEDEATKEDLRVDIVGKRHGPIEDAREVD